MPRYQLNPPPLQPRQSGALGQVGNLALQKGLQYGINAAIPGWWLLQQKQLASWVTNISLALKRVVR